MIYTKRVHHVWAFLALTCVFSAHAESPARWQAGLLGGQLNSVSLNTVDYPASPTVYAEPHCTTNRNAACGNYTASDTPIWTKNRTWVYWGQMYFEGGAYRFGSYMCAPLQVKVDGEVVFNVTENSVYTRSAIFTPTRGWHAVEFRVFSGTASIAGPVPATTAYTWTSTFGFGVTMKYADIPSPYGYRYFYPVDDGSRTLFRHDDGTGDTASLDIDAFPSRFGTPSPDYGYVAGLTNKEDRIFAGDTAFVNETPTNRMHCTGWRIFSGGRKVAHGAGTSCSYTHSTNYVNPTLEWVWKEQNLLAFSAVEGGDVSTAGGWCDEDATLTVTATPDTGFHFYKWAGDVADGQTFAATLNVPGNKPRVLTAVFEPDALLRDNVYQGASGGNWDTASNWILGEVPGSNDNVHIRASVNVFFSNIVDIASLVISNGACLSANFTGANIAVRDRSAVDTTGNTAFGIRVRGDMTMLGNGKLYIGGHGQKAPSILEVKGNLALSGTANELALYACPTNNNPADFQTGGARVTVGGDTTIAAGCWIYPFTERTTGRTVIFDLRDLSVAANGGFNGKAIGFIRATTVPCSQDTGLWTGDGQWGASHGGNGGLGTPAYDYMYAPIYPGAGGNAGNGGANIRISARDIVLDGTLDARPGNATTSGGGGGVWVTCDSLTPSPSAAILAQGLDSGRGGGGGGRVAIGLGLLPYQIDELYARGGTPGLFIGSIAAVLSRPLTVNVAGGLGVSDSQNGQPGSEYAYVSLADEDCVVLAVSIDADHTATITADPPLGFNVLAVGTNVQNASIASPAATRVDGAERMYCTGYTFTAGDGGTVTGSGSTIASLPALDGNATLVWHFSNREYTVTCSVLGDTAGTVVVGGGNGNWIAENATATLTATPSDAQVYEFQYWLGDVPYENRYDNPLALDVDAPKTLTAFFGKVEGATYRSADSDGDWYSATRWTPNGIPGMRDKAVLNSAATKRKIRLPDFFAIQELVVSNTCLLVAAADTSVNSTYTDYRGFVSYQPATSRDTARIQPIGFDVTGNLLIDKRGIVYAGGSGQLAYTKVNIDGDLAVTSGGLQLSAGVVTTNVFPTSGASADGDHVPYTDLQELFKGGNFLKVAGGTHVGPSGKIHTLNEYRCGAAVHLDLAVVTVDEGGLFTGYVGGYNRFVLDNRVYTMCPGGLKTGDNKHGGSYGGRGGGQTVNSVSTIVPYGFTNAPFYPGSPHGAGSFRGGGTIRMDAKSLTLNGTLISSGYTGNKGASAGGGIWVNCTEFSIGEKAVISVEGGSGVLTAGSGGGGGRAAICIGLSDDQMLQLFTNDTHAAEGVTVSSLAESIGARFTAAGGPGNASYSPGTDGSGVYIISTLGKKILNIYGEPSNYGIVTPDYGPQTFDDGATVAFSAPEYVLVSDDNRSRRVCLGYSVTNAAAEVLAQGTGHAGSFTIDSDCWLVWNWDLLEHEFISRAVGGGILVTNVIPNTDSTWQPDQGAISITAVADSGFMFAGWYGDVTDGAQYDATLSLNLDRGRTLGALFVPVATGAREWTGQGDGTTWIDPENWSPVGIPGPAEQITITNGMVAANHCIDVEVGSLHVGTNATLTVATGSGFSTFTHLLSWAVPTDWLPCALKAAGDVVVDGTLVVGKKYSLSHADLIVNGNLSIGGRGKVYLHAGYNDGISYSSFTNWAVGGAGVRVGGRTELASGAWIYPWCEGLSGAPVVFNIGDLNIATNAGVRAVGAGWFWTTIEGVDFARWPTPQIGNVYTGGAYGGKSGDGVSHPATALPYGLATAPYMPGSSGGNGRITGGGSIRIHAGVIRNNGTLDASGANGWSSAGGGSGGGIWLTCMKYRTSVTSVTRADGGANNEGQAGGGGGRICIAIGLKDSQVGEFYETGAATGRYTVIDLTDEAIDVSQYVKGVISAAGGISSATSTDCDGKPGTVVWIETPPPGTLIILR